MLNGQFYYLYLAWCCFHGQIYPQIFSTHENKYKSLELEAMLLKRQAKSKTAFFVKEWI